MHKLIKYAQFFQAKVGREKEFQLALRKLRGKDVDISDEANEILVHSKLS